MLNVLHVLETPLMHKNLRNILFWHLEKLKSQS